MINYNSSEHQNGKSSKMKQLKLCALMVSMGILAGCFPFMSNGPSDWDAETSSAPLGAPLPEGQFGAQDATSPVFFQNTVGDRVLFAVDQSVLSEQSRILLNAQASWLMRNADYSALIEGHADQQGTREYNLALGARRANAVREYLVSRGVASNRLETISYGKERPVEFCAQETCYQKNRRAVTVIRTAGLRS